MLQFSMSVPHELNTPAHIRTPSAYDFVMPVRVCSLVAVDVVGIEMAVTVGNR